MNDRKNLIVIKCPQCGSQLSFKPMPNYRQKKVTCPKCKHVAVAGDYHIVYDPGQVAKPDEREDTEMASGAPVAVIRCVETGEKFPLHMGNNRIGRKAQSPKAEIQFTDNDRYISKLHASISVINAGGRIQLHLRDEGSTNGTAINGKAIPPGSIALLGAETPFTMGKKTFVCSVISAQ